MFSSQNNNPDAVMPVNQRTKEKRGTFVALRIHLYLILNSVFDNFIQFLYISSLLKGTDIYDIYYNGVMWRLF